MSVQISVVISQTSAEGVGTNVHYMLQEAADADRAALEKQLGNKITDLQESEARLASKSDVLEQEVLRLTERLSTYDGVHGEFERLQASMEDTQVSPYTAASGNVRCGINVCYMQIICWVVHIANSLC